MALAENVIVKPNEIWSSGATGT